MDITPMKTTMTAIALVLALGTSAYAQDVKPSMTPTAPAAAATVPAATAAPAAKPVLAPETMQKVGAPSTSVVPMTAPKAEVKPMTAPSTATAPVAPIKTAAPVATKTLNINTVTTGELEKLPKIGEARAKQIVAGRPYKSVDDLISKKVLPQDAFDAVKGLISVQ